MITISNYQSEKANINWASMPKQIQDARTDIDDIIEFYNDDTDIKETVDLFFKGINENKPKDNKKPTEVKKKTIATLGPKAKGKTTLKADSNLSIRKAMAATTYLKDVMNTSQQQALFGLEDSEEKQFFIDKIKELDQALTDAKKRQDGTIMDSIVKMHFFYGQTHWYIFDFNPKENEFFGYVVLNGDTQMSEAGYISIDELKSIKGIEMDFYFNPQELGKVLHKAYPDEFPAYKSEAAEKPAAVAKTKTAKTKVEKSVDKKVVDNYSVEYQLIRRFWNLIKNETKIIIPFRQVQLLHMAYNKAAVERKVRKTSSEADLFSSCNKKINSLFEKFDNPNQIPYEIDFTDKKLYNEIREFATGFEQNKAIPVLKRFIGMQNTMPDVKKAATLLKSIHRLIDNDSSNRLLPELKKAASSLGKYLEKPKTSLPTEVYGLSVPRNVCTNRIKCAGIDKSGKLHKGYRFEEHTGHIVKVKKSKSSKRKPGTSKKKVNAGSLGYSIDESIVEKIYVNPNETMVPITNKRLEPEIIEPTVTEEIKPEPVPEEKPVSNKLMDMTFEALEMTDGWEEFMQHPAKNLKIGISGKPKNGKTAGSLKLAKMLTKHGKVLYNFVDQGFNKSTQDLWILAGLANNRNAVPSDIRTLNELEKEIKAGKYSYVFIDMINDYIDMEKITPQEFKDRFIIPNPNVGFILVFEVTKNGDFKGDAKWMHIVDAIAEVENFCMDIRGRYGMGHHIIWDEGMQRLDPKRYTELMNDRIDNNQIETI